MLALGLLLATADVSATLDFAIGSTSTGPVHASAAPGGQLDVGASFGRLRLQAMGTLALWEDDAQTPGATARATMPAGPASGAFARLGAGARYTIEAPANLGLYVEGDLGREWTPLGDRNDLGFGFGFQQTEHVWSVLLGGHLGVRVLVARGTPHEDITVFALLGVGVGK